MKKTYSERAYQREAQEKARDAIRSGHKRIILQLPCGGGKTVIAAEITKSAKAKGNKVLFLVNRRELVFQARDKMRDYGLRCGVIMAGEPHDHEADTQVASMQTYVRRMDLDELRFNRWWHDSDLIFVDECHTSISPTYQKILRAYGDRAIVIGLTATPCRSDGRGLGAYYSKIVKTISTGDLIDQGFLTPYRYFAPFTPDLSDVPIVANDYSLGYLGEKLNRKHLIGDIYENWSIICPDRPTIIFATTIKHSLAIAQRFQEAGVAAEHIDHKTPKGERDIILKRYLYRDVQVLVNQGILCEGTDLPLTSCIVFARPTKSYGRFVQMGGRGGRPSDETGKRDCIILDHGGCVNEHGFLEDDREWSLDDKQKAWHSYLPPEKEERPVICQTCGCVTKGGTVCPQCGSPIKRYGKNVDTREGELVEVGKREKYTEVEKRQFYGMCKWVCLQKGYQEGYISHKFKEKFGVWPKGFKDTAPIIPDQGFRNWMKHINIKRAKAKAKGMR
jgi:superfamily II DNA or RNA helicase